MSGFADVVLLVCADSAQTNRLVAGLSATRAYVHVPLATQVAHAMRMLERLSPHVIVLDASALDVQPACEWQRMVAPLSKHAPVVIVVPSERFQEFASLEVAGAIDVVEQARNFAQIVSSIAARKSQPATQPTSQNDSYLYGENFGELLRHEMNNPLTGILGNAELLLAKRDHLPAQAAAQLQTIAQLAIRLRETVRRLSDTWETSRHHAHTI